MTTEKASTISLPFEVTAKTRGSWLGLSPQMQYPLLIIPAHLFLIAFFVYPIVIMLARSFLEPKPGLDNFARLFSVPLYFKILRFTFQVAVNVTLLCLILGYPIAYLLASVTPKTRNLLMVMVILPFWTSLMVRNYSWMILLGRYGFINTILEKLGVEERPQLLYTSFAVKVGMVHILLPFMILTLYAVMAGIDRNLLKAAQSLGANTFQAFLRVYFPLSLPGVAGGCLLVFVIALGFFITPALLGSRQDITISQLIASQVGELLNWGFGATLAFVLLAITLAVLVIYNRLLGLDRIWGGTR